VGDKTGLAASLEACAALDGARGHPERAALLLGAASALRETLGAPLPAGDRPAYDQTCAALRTALGEDRFAAQWGAGRALPLEVALARALDEAVATPGMSANL
jgi:hypothetical protein